MSTRSMVAVVVVMIVLSGVAHQQGLLIQNSPHQAVNYSDSQQIALAAGAGVMAGAVQSLAGQFAEVMTE